MNQLIDQLKAARDVSTPLIFITSPDQPAAASAIVAALNGDTPIVSWDRVNGFLSRNKKGDEALQQFCEATEIDGGDLATATCEPHNAFRLAAKLPGAIKNKRSGTILIAFSLNRFLHSESEGQTLQALLNLRDLFKGDQRTVLGLSGSFDLPDEVKHDVILLDDPLPEDEQYGTIIKDLYEGASIKKLPPEVKDGGVRSVRGLSAFEAEQVLAMSIASTGFKSLDLPSAWKLKVGAVSKIKGLTMTLDGPDLKDLRGLDSVTATLNDLWKGPQPPELVVRVDEIDKAMAGLGTNGGPGDNTGVSQDLHQNFLTSMEDNGWVGAILVGIRGSGKTVLTQSIGVAHGVPTIAMDAGAMKGKHVGESEQAFREAFRTIKSIGGSRVLVLATCNKLDVMPPELLRRFKLQVWYFDLLTDEERDALWPVYLKKYGHPLDSERPNDAGWTGAEIRNCCEMAYMLGRKVKAYGETGIIPVTVSDPVSVQALRDQANNRFLSASYLGKYRKPLAQAAVEPAGTASRMGFAKVQA